MSQESDLYIISLLLNLKEANLFDDNDLFSQLKTLHDNFNSEEVNKKAVDDANKFIEFYNKSSLIPHTSVPRPLTSGVPVRMYMDGVFDMVHSGHFNAIRQVNNEIKF